MPGECSELLVALHFEQQKKCNTGIRDVCFRRSVFRRSVFPQQVGYIMRTACTKKPCTGTVLVCVPAESLTCGHEGMCAKLSAL